MYASADTHASIWLIDSAILHCLSPTGREFGIYCKVLSHTYLPAQQSGCRYSCQGNYCTCVPVVRSPSKQKCSRELSSWVYLEGRKDFYGGQQISSCQTVRMCVCVWNSSFGSDEREDIFARFRSGYTRLTQEEVLRSGSAHVCSHLAATPSDSQILVEYIFHVKQRRAFQHYARCATSQGKMA